MTAAGLVIDVVARRGRFALEVSLDLPPGQVLAVLGPNGSGKSTLLDVVAGILPPSRGSVGWRGRALSAATGARVPVASRRVGLLRQEPLLFPHLSAIDNVAFGPRAQRRADAETVARRWLERLGAQALADRRPRELSGGQAARVALARALAAEPDVLLLDEPFAALDVEAAPTMRDLLAEVVAEHRLTTVLVSHDVIDAALLADRVAVLRDGTVVESGPRDHVLGAPRTAFTAALVGVNLVPAGFGGLRASGGAVGTGQLRFRPGSVELGRRPRWSQNTWRVRVRALEPATGAVRVRLTAPEHPDAPDVLADVDAAAVGTDALRPGADAWAHVAPDAVAVV